MQGLNNSSWVPPPSLKMPAALATTHLDVVLDELSLQDIQRAWFAAVRAYFSRDKIKLGLRLFGPRLGLLQMYKVAAQAETLQARVQEAPQLAPLLALDPGMWSNLPNWQLVQRRMLAMGLTKRAWRWLCKQPAAYLAKIDWARPMHLAWVNLHAEVSAHLPVQWVDPQTAALKGFEGLQSWLRRNQEQFAQPRLERGLLNVLRVLRLCMHRRAGLESQAHGKELEREEFPLIADWVVSTVAAPGFQLTRQWTYDTIMARQAHWHLVELRIEQGHPNVFWPELLGMGQVGMVDFIELNSLNALLSEAKKMHHCVPSYIDRCMDGEVCLFHLQLRGPSPKRATLELRRAGAQGWKVAQLKGPCNGPVDGAMWQAAQQVLFKLQPAISSPLGPGPWH